MSIFGPKNVKNLHVINLRSILQCCLDKADFTTAASVAAVLLHAQVCVLPCNGFSSTIANAHSLCTMLTFQEPGIGEGMVREADQTNQNRNFDDLLQVCIELLLRREPLSPDNVSEFSALVHVWSLSLLTNCCPPDAIVHAEDSGGPR